MKFTVIALLFNFIISCWPKVDILVNLVNFDHRPGGQNGPNFGKTKFPNQKLFEQGTCPTGEKLAGLGLLVATRLWTPNELNLGTAPFL